MSITIEELKSVYKTFPRHAIAKDWEISIMWALDGYVENKCFYDQARLIIYMLPFDFISLMSHLKQFDLALDTLKKLMHQRIKSGYYLRDRPTSNPFIFPGSDFDKWMNLSVQIPAWHHQNLRNSFHFDIS